MNEREKKNQESVRVLGVDGYLKIMGMLRIP